jgi:hypothetical protein
MRGTRDQSERSRCDDLVLIISAEIQRRTGWNVHPCALIERHDARHGKALATEHDELVRRALAVFVVATPASFGVGWAARGIPADVPCVYLAERGNDLSHVVERDDTRYWSSEQEILDIVGAFADSLLTTAPITRPATPGTPADPPTRPVDPATSTSPLAGPPAPSRSTSKRRPERRGNLGKDDGFLPGMGDKALIGQFRIDETRPDPSAAAMRRVLDRVAWRGRRWLTEAEFVAAQSAKRRYHWDNSEFNDAVAFMTMTRAFEHFAPQFGIRTRRRSASTDGDWERLRERRRRSR